MVWGAGVWARSTHILRAGRAVEAGRVWTELLSSILPMPFWWL